MIATVVAAFVDRGHRTVIIGVAREILGSLNDRDIVLVIEQA